MINENKIPFLLNDTLYWYFRNDNSHTRNLMKLSEVITFGQVIVRQWSWSKWSPSVPNRSNMNSYPTLHFKNPYQLNNTLVETVTKGQ